MNNDSSNKSDSSDITMFIIVIILAGLFVSFFYVFPLFLIYPWATFRLIESYALGLVSETHVVLRSFLLNSTWTKITYEQAFTIEYALARHSTWIYATFFLKPIYNIVTKNTLRDTLSQRLTLEEVLDQQTKTVWRYNRWLTKINPSEESSNVRQGRFAIRESMYSGLKRSKAITINRLENTLHYDETKLKKIFLDQLQHQNLGLDKLTELQKKIFCIFALREPSLPPIFDKKKAFRSKMILMAINFIKWPFNIPIRIYTNMDIIDFAPKFVKNKIIILHRHQLTDNEDLRIEYLGDLSFVISEEMDNCIPLYLIDEIYKKAKVNQNILNISSQHAFVETFLRRMLFEARNYGKLPPNHFSWLKLEDRALWYALNDEMLPSASYEAMGVKSHFELELEAKMAEPFPQIEQGVVLVKSIAESLSTSEFDYISVEMKHPYRKVQPHDPSEEFKAHELKLKNDPEYELHIFKIKNGIKDED